ncbi:MAG: c-type cytochrome, partial [Saprospiraceae bacterium]
AKQANLVDETNVSLLTDEESLAGGKEIFTTLCAACHLDHGGGALNSVGPNLTDKYWLHGGSIVDVFSTIKYGVPDKGMISWRTQIRPADMQKVASYVLSLQGTNPLGAKEAQGELYEPESSIVESEKDTGAEAAATEEM